MCTFMSALPKRSKSNGGSKKQSLVMSFKPCEDEQTFYRVRLLAFGPSAASGSDRDDPWIERFVHQHWGTNAEKGYPVLEDEIVCPVTPHVHVEGDKYESCKICNLANKYFLTFKASGWKDKSANKKNKELGRKYQAIIPVYVVNNPNWEGDNGKLKVMIFNDKKFYQEFRKKVTAASAQQQVFNGKNAVDCCLHVKIEEEVVNKGQPNEYIYKKKVIDKVVFSTKPYDIESITKEAVDNMGFDDEYYSVSTQDEIDRFYKKYCTVSNDDIPMDDSVQVYDEPKRQPATPATPATPAAPAVSTANPAPAKPTADVDLDQLMSDPDDLPAVSTPSQAESKDVDAESLLEGLDL